MDQPRRQRRSVRWVVFDVGETLVDESRMWNEWADILDIPRFTFAAALGAVIARGEDHRRVFDIVAPGVDWRSVWTRSGLPTPSRIEEADMYPDVRSGLAIIRAAGFMIGIAGNQPATTEESIARTGLPFDLVATSETLGATKPDALFFERLVVATGVPAAEVAYVGDRFDNDVEPAEAAGLYGILLRRGPWAVIGAALRPPNPSVAVVDSIAGVADLLDPVVLSRIDQRLESQRA